MACAYLCFDEFVQVLDGLGLGGKLTRRRKKMQTVGTYVFENGLHERDCDLGLLDEVVFCVLDVELCLFLPSRTCGLQTSKKKSVSVDRMGMCATSYDCLAASSSSLLARTA